MYSDDPQKHADSTQENRAVSIAGPGLQGNRAKAKTLVIPAKASLKPGPTPACPLTDGAGTQKNRRHKVGSHRPEGRGFNQSQFYDESQPFLFLLTR
jgi:hypothetical protein